MKKLTLFPFNILQASPERKKNQDQSCHPKSLKKETEKKRTEIDTILGLLKSQNIRLRIRVMSCSYPIMRVNSSMNLEKTIMTKQC